MSDKFPYQKQYKYSPWMEAYYTDTFCTNCWTHERFFTGGQSTAPDLCPCGCEDTNVWYKMGPLERRKAKKKYKEDYEKWLKKIRKINQ